MSITWQAALDELFGMAKSAIDANAPTILGYAPDVRYVGVPQATRPDMSKHWLRVSAQIVTDGLAALASANGKQLYEAIGLFYVCLYCPRNEAGSRDPKGLTLAEAIRTAIRGGSPSGEIWFVDPKIVELPETLESYPINIVAKFSYRTISI